MRLIGFICTGNTCRSPMAECYFKSIIKNYDDIKTFSAGLSAGYGWRAANESIRMMRKLNLDLSYHISKPLSDEMVKEAEMLIVMTQMHKEKLLATWPGAVNKVFILREFEANPDFEDLNIMDPVGCPIEIYEKCFDLMKVPLERLGEILCKKYQ